MVALAWLGVTHLTLCTHGACTCRRAGEEVFSESRSLLFKSLKVRRLVDRCGKACQIVRALRGHLLTEAVWVATAFAMILILFASLRLLFPSRLRIANELQQRSKFLTEKLECHENAVTTLSGGSQIH